MRSNYLSTKVSIHFVLLFLSVACNATDMPDANLPEVNSSEQSVTFAVGNVSPLQVTGVPDWALEGVRDCYNEALRINPNQEGHLDFSIRAPESNGSVLVDVEVNGSISYGLVACVETALGEIFHYNDSGRSQENVKDRLNFKRSLIQVLPPPDNQSMRSMAAEKYASKDVVEVVEFVVTSLKHSHNEYSITKEWLERNIRYKVVLRFKENGYEGKCYHNGYNNRFDTKPIEEFFFEVCENKSHQKGDLVEDSGYFRFYLRGGHWVW